VSATELILAATVRVGVAAAFFMAVTQAGAQSPTPAATVTEGDIARARQAQPVISDADIERAARANPMPTEAQLARVPAPTPPRLDALPQPNGPATDLAAVARGYDQSIGETLPDASLATGPRLYVFVSFTMPPATLARLVDQAARCRAVLLLRGLVDGSLKQTALRVKQLIGSRKVGFQIDPQAFDRFAVTATPTFVLVHEGAVASECGNRTCYAADAFISATGDVSIDYALELFQRSAPGFDREARTFLERLKG
jgi:conjugal transfer pilus assembly protein TrbC